MKELNSIILCNKEDLNSLKNGEHLSFKNNGFELKVSTDIKEGIVLIYDEMGFSRTVFLK